MKTLKNNVTILLLVITSFPIWSQYANADIDVINESIDSIEENISYDSWSKILRKNASVLGAINYTGFKKDHKQFNYVLKKIAAVEVKKSWNRKTQLAHWINVYNAYSIKLIADHFPAKRLSEIGKIEKIKFFEINNNMMSLADVEDIIKGFNDVRALLVLHRGAKSSIKMDKNAYTADNLEKTLEKKMRVFINNTRKNKITAQKVELSGLIKSYKKEVEKEYSSVKEFVNTYSNISLNYGQKISYLTYDDTINSFQEVF